MHQAMTTTDTPPTTMFQPGNAVEIWNRSLARWTGGFTVYDLVGGGCRVVRPGDLVPIPHVFGVDGVRLAGLVSTSGR